MTTRVNLNEVHEWAKKLCEAIGVDANAAHRIIIDIQVDRPMVVYVELFASKQMLTLQVPDVSIMQPVVLG